MSRRESAHCALKARMISPKPTFQQIGTRGLPARGLHEIRCHDNSFAIADPEARRQIELKALGLHPGLHPGSARQISRIEPGKRMIVNMFASDNEIAVQPSSLLSAETQLENVCLVTHRKMTRIYMVI